MGIDPRVNGRIVRRENYYNEPFSRIYATCEQRNCSLSRVYLLSLTQISKNRNTIRAGIYYIRSSHQCNEHGANTTSASAINARRRVALADRSSVSRRAAVLLPDHRFANSLGATLSRRHPRKYNRRD